MLFTLRKQDNIRKLGKLNYAQSDKFLYPILYKGRNISNLSRKSNFYVQSGKIRDPISHHVRKIQVI